jgi:GNAT superfamily N-acetyltransferase
MSEFAEDLGAFTMRPGDPLFHRDPQGRFLIFFGPGSHPVFNSVFRFRLAEDADLPAVVEEIREVIRGRGRTGSTWEVGSSATPSGLADRLLELGLVPYEEPVAAAMLLDHPPAGTGGEDVEVRRVGSLEAFRTAQRISSEAFGVPRDNLDDDEALAKEFAGMSEAGGMVFLAYLGGEPVGQGTAFATVRGVSLAGGSVLPAHRGAGAYRALVLARWDEAVRRGTPLLATNAGAMSRPILERLGFRQVAEIRILLDEAGAGSG